MMRARVLGASLLLALSMMVATRGAAYTTVDTSNPSWPGGAFAYVINASSFTGAGLNPGAVQSSYSTWTVDPIATVTCTRGPDTLGTGSDNNINEVYFVSSGWSGGAGVLAITYFQYTGSGAMTEADILVNGDFNWASPTLAGCSGNTYDLQATVAHEAGHALGLGHSSESQSTCTASSGAYDQGLCEATMYYAGGPCDTSTQSLECDDKAGIRFLYPPSGVARADWTQSGFTASPSGGDIAPGATITINGTATNTGSIPTVAGLAGLFVSPTASLPGGSPVKTQALAATDYCKTRSVALTHAFSAADAGTRYLVVKLDSSSTTSEYLETDASNVAFLGPYNVVASPIVEVDQSALTFNAIAAAGNPASQSVLITNSGGGTFTWSATDDRSWLSVAPTSGAPGASCAVSVNTSGLAAGTHTGTVTVTAPGAAGSPKSVAVTLNLTSGAVLAVSPASLSFAAAPGGALPPSQQLSVSNTGGGTLSWTASDDAGWLSVAPAGGTNAGTVVVSVTSTAMAAGQYSATVTIDGGTASGSPMAIPVTFNVSSAILSVSPGSLSFAGAVGGSAPASQQLSVVNAGSGAMSYSASSNRAWLSVTPASGSAPATLTVTVNPSGLSGGTQTGAITVTSAGATGSPATIPVSYTLSSQPSIGLSTTSMSFAAAQGATPAAQTLTISNDGAATLSYSVSDDAAWLSATPASGTLISAANRAHQVTASAASLGPGTYNATITVTDPAADDSPRQVAVAFEVTANPPLSIAPTTMAFSATAAQPTPASQSLIISTGGSATAAWSISSSQGWLSAVPSSGIGDATISVSASAASDVPVGTNVGILTVTAPSLAGSPKQLNVTLSVAAGPRVSISPSVAAWSVARLAPLPSPVTVSVSNAGTGALAWTASGAPSWLQVTPASGSAPGSFSLQPTRTDLAAGRYTATINVSATSAYDSPRQVGVTYDIVGPALTFAPERVSFDIVGGVPAATSIPVNLGAGGAWTAVSNRPWISVSPTSGSGDATLTISLVGAASLPVGVLDAAVIVTQAGASNSPAPLPVVVTSRAAAALSIWPTRVAGDAMFGPLIQPLGALVLDEAADGVGAWSLGARPSWLVVSAESGTNGSRLALSVDPTGLPAGTAWGALEIDAEEGVLSVPIAVTIHDRPALTSSPASLSLLARAGSASSDAESVVVTNVGALPSAFTATPSESWLVVTGLLVAPSTLSVSALATSLTAGTYTAVVTLTAGANVMTLPVTLTVVPAAAPLANFTVTPLTSCGSLTPTVDNLTTGATSQAWFVDGISRGTFLEGVLPVVLTSPGDHVVTLTATNASGSSSRSKVVTVSLPPLASAGADRSMAFEADGQTSIRLDAARVAAAAPARVASLAWTTNAGTFEDSGTTTSALERPTLRLSSGRGGISATLSLAVADDRGCTASDQMVVTVLSDLDGDSDGKIALLDNCPALANSSQADFDLDGIGDACDSCPTAADATSADVNANGQGDACEAGLRKTLSLADVRARACQGVASIPVRASLSALARRLRVDLSGGRAPSGASALGVAGSSGGTARITMDGTGVELLVPAGLRFDGEDVLAIEVPLQSADQLLAVPCASARVAFGSGEVAGTCDGANVDLRADGDVTGPTRAPDGVVDVSDVVRLLRVSVNLDELSADAEARGDIAPGTPVAGVWRAASDCRIDVADVVIALRASVGLVTLP